QWPLDGPPPDLTWGTALTVLLLASLWPAWRLSHAARRRDLPATRYWAIVVTVLNLAALVLRGFEFPLLNTRWAHDPSGSGTRAPVLLHALHMVTDFIDPALLTGYPFAHEVAAERFSDVDDDAVCWAFVVLAWLPFYALVYWAARWVP